MSRSRVLSLYRDLLRVHAAALPAELRALGDSYVRAEFRAHKTAAPKFVGTFLASWERYLAELRARHALSAGAGAGRDLADDDAQALSPEQRETLETLRREAQEAGAALGGGGAADVR